MADFVAVDVETANADFSSVCQIGVVAFDHGRVEDSWQTLVDPEDEFDVFNVAIHHIDQRAVRGAPTFPEIYESVSKRLADSIVACHTPFDRVAVERVVDKYGLEQLACAWLDTARVARRAWPQFSRRGYGLANVAGYLGITFDAHNAEEDARAAGELLVRAIEETGLAVHEWQERVNRPIGLAPGKATIAMDGNPEGSLYGDNVVFTGKLTIPRALAAQMAADAGCKVAASLCEDTTLLVVGDQDIRRLAGYEKSSKRRKAERLIAQGLHIRILGESDFRRLVGLRDSL